MSALKNPDDMSPEQLSIALQNTQILELWITSVRKRAHDLLTEGGRIPGFTLGLGVRKRIWREGSEQQVRETLLENGIDESDFMTEPALKSPAQIDAVLKERNLYPKIKRGVKEKPITIITPFTDKSAGKLKLVADRGPAGEVDAKHQEAILEFSDNEE